MSANIFLEKATKQAFLIMAHRGFWGGNIIENTIESAALAFKAGADIVEVDVCRTADNKYYLFHDGNEQKLLSRSENFKTLTSAEVEQSDVLNSIGTKSGYKINTLQQFLDWLPKDKLVNLDRSWEYWDDEEFFNILNESGNQNQLVLKSPVKKEYLEKLSKNGQNLAYIPIVKRKNEYGLVLSYPDINTIGMELVIADVQSNLLDKSWLSHIKEKNLLFVANSENLGAEFNLFFGLNDDTALLDDSKWDAIVQLGVDVIQTDWPNFLNEYRKNLEEVGE